MDFRDGPQPAFPWLLLGFFALSCADSSPDPEATTQVQAEVAPEAQATPPPVEEVPEEPEVREPLVFDLIVSEDIQQTIVPLSKSVYGEEELDETFALVRKRGDAYCAVLDGAEDPGDRTAHAFVAPNKYRTLRYACRGCKDNVRLGCWNLFRMNDRSPQRDMQLVKTLWPEENYDCYAVGMVQPYMMHDILQCSTLTTLDFDWRIQDAHRQLLQAYRDGKVIDQGALEAVLGQVTIGWIAHSETPRPSHPATLPGWEPSVRRASARPASTPC